MTAAPQAPRRGTAEWLCARCGSTNRRLVPADAAEAADRCVSCKRKHVLTRQSRPVRWAARPA